LRLGLDSAGAAGTIERRGDTCLEKTHVNHSVRPADLSGLLSSVEYQFLLVDADACRIVGMDSDGYSGAGRRELYAAFLAAALDDATRRVPGSAVRW
jgi:hypothetical protein